MSEVWQTYYEKGKEDTEEEEKREPEAIATIKNAEIASNAVIEAYLRKGLEANKGKRTKGKHIRRGSIQYWT